MANCFGCDEKIKAGQKSYPAPFGGVMCHECESDRARAFDEANGNAYLYYDTPSLDDPFAYR